MNARKSCRVVDCRIDAVGITGSCAATSANGNKHHVAHSHFWAFVADEGNSPVSHPSGRLYDLMGNSPGAGKP